MDKLAHLGSEIEKTVGPSFQVYGEILNQPANAAAIHDIKVSTISYGPDERQKLDLYEAGPVSPAPTPGKKRPILIFVYGGGFINGDKVLAEIPGNVVYTNLASFFTKKFGFDVIIPDYRLARHGAKYPSGAEDINGTVKWVTDHYSNQRRDIFIMGNSAGGCHVATWLFSPETAREREQLTEGVNGLRLRGAIILGAPLTITESTQPLFMIYFKDEALLKENHPIALMRKAAKQGRDKAYKAFPPMLALISGLDPDVIVPATEQFVREWQEAGGRIEKRVLEGHNHLSPPLALGTNNAKEEEWGMELGKWMTSIAAKP